MSSLFLINSQNSVSFENLFWRKLQTLYISKICKKAIFSMGQVAFSKTEVLKKP